MPTDAQPRLPFVMTSALPHGFDVGILVAASESTFRCLFSPLVGSGWALRMERHRSLIGATLHCR